MTIVYDGKGSELDSIAAHLFAQDLEKVPGTKHNVNSAIPIDGVVVIIVTSILNWLSEKHSLKST